MANYFTFFDSPDNYANPGKYYSQGSSPELLNQLIKYLKSNEDSILSIQICSYLFNNEALYSELCNYAKNGVKIQVVTIPIEGYDDRSPQYIIDLNSNDFVFNDRQTKYSLARKIFGELYKQRIENFELYFFPHMFIRSEYVNPFSRGDMPYSLHLKSFFIKCKNNLNTTILTSSSLAVRDLIKDESLIICEDDEQINGPTEIFFRDLIENSILINDFNFESDYTKYELTLAKNPSSDKNIFISPLYEDSPDAIEDRLKKMFINARDRVYVVAQHISSYKYQIPIRFKIGGSDSGSLYKNGFLFELLNLSAKNIDIKCISQTFVNSRGEDMGARKPANTKSFIEFIKEFETHPNAEYASNSNLHSKYIICDDIVIITSCNFTPTQFIYLKHVNIPQFLKMPDLSYQGIHSEVGQYLLLQDNNVLQAFLNNFEILWNSKSTRKQIVY